MASQNNSRILPKNRGPNLAGISKNLSHVDKYKDKGNNCNFTNLHGLPLSVRTESHIMIVRVEVKVTHRLCITKIFISVYEVPWWCGNE